MGERRMFAKTIVLSDAFLDMDMSTRCLYFALGMVADDEGFVNSPKSVVRQCGSTLEDLKNLEEKEFIISFPSGVIVIKHWRIHNYIQNDRFKPSLYKKEREQLIVDKKGGYKLDTSCIHPVSKMDTEVKLSKDKLSKDNISLCRYFDDDQLNDAFIHYLEMRRESKFTTTSRAIELAISTLKKLATEDGVLNVRLAIDIVNQSILEGWKSFYELNPGRKAKKSQFAQFKTRTEDLDDLAKKIFAN